MKNKYSQPKITKKKLRLNFMSRNNRFYDSYDLLLNNSGVLLAQSGCGGCFLQDTLIATPGKNRKINHFQPGDTVLSYNFKKHNLTKNKVVEVLKHQSNDGYYYLINKKIKVTGNHPMFTNNQTWKRVDQLTLSDTLLNENGEPEEIKQIEKRKGGLVIYNLHLQNQEHNYFANGVLAHNAAIDSK
ncbi:hypothetical protein A2313_00860 [Candidatus Roizmanbacteria bacterium RIFOXYB2_FULL_41_10]|uniref:Hint domain-containing protein n=1 Tax=Candidatus Roizmanbacteria bacterium RIFOXYA1_FULL_41_12 TaxID=1802082 RepID=A0A1F7KFB3_9BACT|nr:MAG: hypothetical protein A2262_03675 [Candidatus Roizmanbacteria bacterium RIFOXYA2_FULL_41_8]OGK66545.1 MAG: hypothetical protein A2209_00915 [Candidatus Roizmanbacteria bacterium RIFOXYA1_FULL_41_12]OGK67244.1 MAG: hypothetical protein A2377_01355 [Candidatus Roizmanbacteria bacterium RIFOXYB1_FULL_41_27]OGK69316.1 MAG: hypothetical protein A2313_00860 [Candidatus Roizmanbacteria bacterium RIFOXYB2_FULL_41_10]OGK71774.1 MAG: hypothetical protein A2403_00225 [Candidatus Roizmanbacteria bac